MAALTIRDVLEAQARLRPHLRPTPLISYPLLNRHVGAEVFVKHENHQPIGSFKVRGALNALALHGGRLAVAASTGNHGQGVAYAARLLGMEAVIVVPERANREKTAAIEALGARVEYHGQTLSDSQQQARELAEAGGGYFAADGLEPAITAGAG